MSGFLSRIFGRKKGHEGDGPKVEKRQKAPLKSVSINIDGRCRTKIYVYLGVVFKDVKRGDEFYVDVVGHDVKLHSRSTGTSTSTAEMGSAALSYKGRVFGSVDRSLGFLKDVAAANPGLKLRVRKVGMYSAGIPDLVALTDSPLALKKRFGLIAPDGSPVFSSASVAKMRGSRAYAAFIEFAEAGAEGKVAKLYPHDDAWIGGKPPAHSKLFSPSFQVLPTKPGSSAKPHILVLDGNKPLFEVAAKYSAAHKVLSENMGSPCEGIIARFGNPSEKNCTAVAIRFS